MLSSNDGRNGWSASAFAQILQQHSLTGQGPTESRTEGQRQIRYFAKLPSLLQKLPDALKNAFTKLFTHSGNAYQPLRAIPFASEASACQQPSLRRTSHIGHIVSNGQSHTPRPPSTALPFSPCYSTGIPAETRRYGSGRVTYPGLSITMAIILDLSVELLEQIIQYLLPDWLGPGCKSLADLAHLNATCQTLYWFTVDDLWAQPTWTANYARTVGLTLRGGLARHIR